MVFNTLSGRFLGLTIIFVMIAEVLIFVPSMARFRENYLQNRLDLSQLAALALLATTEDQVAPELEAELLETADVLNVALQRDEVRELVLSGEMPGPVEASFDISDPGAFTLMRDAMSVLVNPQDRIILVEGDTRQGMGGVIEITMHEAPLRQAMVDFGLRILYLSLAISVVTAGLLFFAVRRLIVKPMKRVVDHMSAYRDAPEDASRIIAPGRGALELRQAEIALHDLQVRLTGALKQKDRLAALGGAVAKISHDLRNMLTTAQLLADRMETSPDPKVKRTAPKLVGSLNRAINLCERTLAFGKAEEPAPELASVALRPLVAEVMENERAAAGDAGIVFESTVAEGATVRADPEQLFRVLSNLVRNAAQAIASAQRPGTVRVSADREAGRTRITVCDTGPGLPPKARENLFKPFTGGARSGGTGLGLVIAAEIVRGHGGTLDLVETGPQGTTFAVSLPAA